MIIAVASGKGGTGKTTVSVNLAKVFGAWGQLLDCDVEEPNAHLFLPSEVLREGIVTIPIPKVDLLRCNGCGDCSDFCQFNAIAVVGKSALVFPELCHACGGCELVCTRRAIRSEDSRIGMVETRQIGDFLLVQGILDVGISSASPLVDAVKQRIQPGQHAILDAPPGTSCPAVATLRNADFTILVTEPTPFGLHDLKLTVAVVRKLGIAFGVVINRHGIGDDRVHRYCAQENIPLLLEIPDDRRIAEAYSQGKLLIESLPEYRDLFERLRDTLLTLQCSADGGATQ
ncbi:MAG: ATP-binding protein [Burkholderiaceae bacterium]|nr:ATP-binding protein [Burkholderiaceae bacterium]